MTNVAKMTNFVYDRAENIVEKEKMLVTSIFSVSTMFSKAFTYRSLKRGIVW